MNEKPAPKPTPTPKRLHLTKETVRVRSGVKSGDSVKTTQQTGDSTP